MSVRMRKKKNLIPRLEACEALLVRNPVENQGKWREIFQKEHLCLEIGCGKGKFTQAYAAAHPEVGLVALERVPEALVMAVEKARNTGLENARYTVCDAAALRDIFLPGELDEIFVNFCDPWVKKKQANRRLVYRDFLNIYWDLLAEGGRVSFKTDNRMLFDFALEELAAVGFTPRNVTYRLAEEGIPGETNITTEYEEKFMALGQPIHRVEMIKISENRKNNGNKENIPE